MKIKIEEKIVFFAKLRIVLFFFVLETMSLCSGWQKKCFSGNSKKENFLFFFIFFTELQKVEPFSKFLHEIACWM